jgi:hypothetical protein
MEQGVGRAAVGDIPGHHVSGRGRAGAFPATTDLLHDIRFSDDIHHRSIGITDDDKSDLSVRE